MSPLDWIWPVLAVGSLLLALMLWFRAQRLGRERIRLRQRIQELDSMLGHTDALLWEADVELTERGPTWNFGMQPSRLADRLFPKLGQGWRITLWRGMNVPEMDEMDARSRDALETGKPGYEQEFRILGENGQVTWIRESVAIQRRGRNRFWLVGLATEVTALREAEALRRTSEDTLREILTRADCLLWRSRVRRTPEGRYEWDGFEMPKSALYPKLFGDRPESMGGKLWSLITTPQLDDMNRRFREALESGHDGYLQVFPAINRHNELFWLQEQVSVRPTDEPHTWHLVGVITNITERRTAEEAVRMSELRYRTLFEHMPVAIVEADFSGVGAWLEELAAAGVDNLDHYFDADPREVSRGALRAHVLQANEAARTLIGAHDTRELRWRRMLFETPSAREAMRLAFQAIRNAENHFETEVQLRRLDGELRETSMRWWVAGMDDGLDLAKAVMIFLDVTELKRAEADLAAQREQLSVTLRSMKECVVTLDAEGCIQYINSTALELVDHLESTAVGRPLAESLTFVDERDGSPVLLPLREVAEHGVVSDLPPRTAVVAPDGRLRLVEGQLAPVHDASSKVSGTVLVFRDITDRDRLEKEMVRATRLESVGVLAGGIAHDFNNILTAVVGNLSVAELDTTAESAVGRAVREAGRAALRAKDLTQQLLTFAKGGEPVREAVRMEAVIREMAGFALHGSNVKAKFEIAPQLWLADVDRGQIGRVVQNLVINAAQAMPEGGTVHIVAANETLANGERRAELEAGRYVRLEITDSGVGIKPEQIGLIFDPYFSTKQAGSGLGLSAAYSIVRKHKGHIDVQSRLGEGTTFRIWLPVAEGEAREEPTVDSAPPFSVGRRVLFMDDDKAIRRMMKRMMERLEVDLVTTKDGDDMVAAFAEAAEKGEPFDLVITDLTVPGGLGGIGALPKLKAIDPQVRVVVSSGYSSDPVMAAYAEHGFWARVSKPYQLPELRRILRDAFDGHAGAAGQ